MCLGTFLRLRHLHCTPQCASPRSVSCVMSHYTRKPRPVKGRGNISETTCYCILTYDLYAPVVTRRIRQNLLIFDLSACNSEVIFESPAYSYRLPPSRLALTFFLVSTVFVIVFLLCWLIENVLLVISLLPERYITFYAFFKVLV